MVSAAGIVPGVICAKVGYERLSPYVAIAGATVYLILSLYFLYRRNQN